MKLNFSEDTYSIENDGDNPIEVVVVLLSDCTVSEEIVKEVLEIGETLLLPLKEDGNYQITSYDSVLDETEEILIKYHLRLQENLMEDLFNVLCTCDCGCKGCTDDLANCELLLTTRGKMDLFKFLNYPRYDAYIRTSLNAEKCILIGMQYCDLTSEEISGSLTFNEKVIKTMLALEYLGMYFQEIQGITDESEIAYIEKKFKTDLMFCCISSMIDIMNVKQEINDKMGNFTINNGAYENLPPDVVGDYVLGNDNRSSIVLTLEMFTSATTPPYNDPESDPADAVRIDTLPEDGDLRLNGTLVTPGQIIDVADINNSLLTYSGPDLDAEDTDIFTFSVRDTGSGEFSS